MKIGILTFHSAHNYGAVLQAWSLQEYLKREGHEVEIVNLRLNVIDKIYRIYRKGKLEVCGNSFINDIADCSYRAAKRTYYNIRKPGKVEKYKKFEHFINYVLPVTKEVNTLQELIDAKLQYDAMIVGSDQVWNAVMMKGINPAFFLQFANKDALRISYAASIGTEVIPEEFRLLFKRYLRDFDAISVREENARQQISMLTDKEVSLISDPTFLLEKKDFEKITKKPRVKQKYIYVHNVHLKRVDSALNSVAEELSKRTGLPIIHNWNQKLFSNEAGYFTGGIEEFLGYVSEAEWVVTNSFHCTVFAITYQRKFITVPHYKHPDRMKYLLSNLGISENLISHGDKMPEDLEILCVDYTDVENKKSVLREEAKGFLKKALSLKKQKYVSSYMENNDIFSCCGCGVCALVCPEKAIVMKEDKEGFRYPFVDAAKCIKCNKCREICISQNADILSDETKEFSVSWYACSKENNMREENPSDIMLDALFRNVLKKGGIVSGVRYDENMQVIYDIAENEDECRAFYGRKYVEAQNEGVMSKIQGYLDEGRYVLFTGTPCDVAALKKYLEKDYENLYTLDENCDGRMSQKLFGKYCDSLENKYQSKMIKFDFNNTFKGVERPFVVTEFESGCVDVEDSKRNNLSSAYEKANVQRPSCYTCKFAESEECIADITLGMLKKEINSEIKNKNSISIIRVNTSRGMLLLEELKDEFILEKKDDINEEAISAKGLIMRSGRALIETKIDEVDIDELLYSANRRG